MSLWALSNPNSINKLKIECIDEEDGSMTIHIEWDENDPDLQWWTDLGEKGQKSFMIDALHEACACYVD
jgi:adenine specific DNA methylase Mod